MQATGSTLRILVGDDKTPITLTDSAVEAIQGEAAGKAIEAFSAIWRIEHDIEGGEGFDSLDLATLLELDRTSLRRQEEPDAAPQARPLRTLPTGRSRELDRRPVVIGKPRGKEKMRPVYAYDRRVRKKVYVGQAKTVAECKEIEAKALLALRDRRVDQWTVKEFSIRWLDKFHGPGTRRPEYTTEMNNRAQIRAFVDEFGSSKLEDLDRAEVLDWARDAKVGQRKVAAAMLNDAIRDGKARVNLLEKLGFKQSRGRRDIHPITEAELEKLAGIALDVHPLYGVQCRAWILFAAWVGLRPAEMFALTFDDLDFKAGRVSISKQIRADGLVNYTKTKTQRTVLLPAPAQDAVRSMNRLPKGWVFVSPKGGQISKGLYRTYWTGVQDRFLGGLEPKRRGELLGGEPNIDFYSLRHFCASWLAAQGADEYDIATQLGNSPQVCREVYIHTYRDQRMDRLGEFFAKAGNVRAIGDQTGSEKAREA
jgi:integrase